MRATLLLGLLACTSALRVDTDLGRRAAMAQGAAGLAAMLAVVAPATSALSDADQSAILERAREGKLRTNLVLERARADSLMGEDGKTIKDATCADLTALVEVDSKALADETKVLADLKKALSKSQTASLKEIFEAEITKVEQMDTRLVSTVAELKKQAEAKCK